MKTLFLFFCALGALIAQVCNETAPCQQLACEQISGYCDNCQPEPLYCDTTGFACDEYTVWTDWWFGTTCDSTMTRYCLYGPCQPFITSATIMSYLGLKKPENSPSMPDSTRSLLRLTLEMRRPVMLKSIKQTPIRVKDRFWWKHASHKVRL